jgi:hypothetical protein
MLHTVMPRAAQAERSTMSEPVAAIAIRRRRRAPRIAASRTGALLVITMSASAMRAPTSSGAVRP